MNERGAHGELLSWRDEHSKFGVFHGGQESHALKTIDRHDQPAGGLRHGFDQQDAWHQWKAGEVTLENSVVRWNRGVGADSAIGEADVGNPVYQLKVLKTHVTCALGSVGRDELVDAGTEVFQHEILVRACLAVIDFLGPLFERKLDPESLVDREGDIEKIEAVDTQVIDRMTLWLDGVARDVAGLSDDIGYGVERRRHL